MKVRIFIIITVLILLSGAAYWYFELERPKSKIEHILPETSLFAIHGTNLKQSLQAIEDYEWFSTAKSIPFVKTVVDWSDKVDSLETSGKLKSSVTQLPFWISFHSTGSSDITPLYIIEASDFKWNSQNIVTILNTLTGTDYTTSTQLFNGFNLLNVKGGNTQLVMLIQGNYLVISEENLLVEDVVRALENESNRLVDSQYKPFVDGDLQLIVNTKRMNELHQVFFSEDLDRSESVGSVAYLNLSFGAESISAQGTSAGGEVIAKEDASLFGKNLIPITSTAFKWMPFNVGMPDLKELLRGEMLAVSLDMNFSDVAEVLLINTADTVYLRRELDRLSESKTSVQDSTVYSESYLNTTLGYIQQSDFVELLTSDERKMDEPYYAIFQNALILSDNLDALKTIMNEFDNESTWGKSVERRRVLDDLVQETDLTIIKDLDYGSESIFDGLKPVWKEFFSKNPGLKTLLKRVQIQLNSNNESYLVSSTLDFNKGNIMEKLRDSIAKTEISSRMMNEPRPNFPLLVLDLDHTLPDFDSKSSNFAKMKRPYMHEFLGLVYQHFDLVIWSQTSWKWLEIKLIELGFLEPSNPYKILFVLDKECMFRRKSRISKTSGKKRKGKAFKPLELSKYPIFYSI